MSSSYWRYRPISIRLERQMSQESVDEYTGKTSIDRMNNDAQKGIVTKLVVQNFLEPMIGTGAERNSYKELMNEFTDRFNNLEAFNSTHWYFDVSCLIVYKRFVVFKIILII